MPVLQNKPYITSVFVAFPIVIGMIFLLLSAILNHQNYLAIFLFLILGTGMAAKFCSRSAFRHLGVDIRLDSSAVFPDEPIRLRITVRNRKLWPVWVQIELPENTRHFFSHDPMARNHTLLWYQQLDFVWELNARHRGCFDLEDFKITAADPLGLFPVIRHYPEPFEILIYPGRVPIKSEGMPKGCFFGAPGEKSPILDPVYVLGTRDYQGNSPARMIHWKTSARYHRLQEKICEPSVQEKILIIVDVAQFEIHDAADDFERTLEVASSMAVRFENAGKAVGFMTNSRMAKNRPGFVPMGRNDRNLAAIFEAMAAMSMASVNPIRKVFHENTGTLWGLSCIFFSLEMDETVREMASFYSLKRIPVQYYVCRQPSDHHLLLNAGKIHQLDELRL